MKFIVQILKLGAIFSLFWFFTVIMIVTPSFLSEPVVFKVQQKYISDNNYRMSGSGLFGNVDAKYSKKFFDKTQIGDTIQIKSAYRLLIRNGKIISIDFGQGAWDLPVMLISSLVPNIIFFQKIGLLQYRLVFWIIGACELLNIYFFGTLIFFRH